MQRRNVTGRKGNFRSVQFGWRLSSIVFHKIAVLFRPKVDFQAERSKLLTIRSAHSVGKDNMETIEASLYYLSLIIIVSFCTCTSCLFVTLETYALHHPQNVPLCFRFLTLRWLPRRLLHFGDGASPPFGRRRRVSDDGNLDVRTTATTTKIENGNEYSAVIDNGQARADKIFTLEMEKIKSDDNNDGCEISSSICEDPCNQENALKILCHFVSSIFHELRQMKKDCFEMNVRLMNKKQQQPSLLTEDWDK
uniref:Uncharacterized protein n=1 Tax=Romanomermis culicivorax TaxID=13658 RepID=A0A915K3Z1_ROMCU